MGQLSLQTVVDTFSSYAFAKIYTSKIAITATDILDDRIMSFFSRKGITINAVLNDKKYRDKQGKEFNDPIFKRGVPGKAGHVRQVYQKPL